MSEIAVAYLTTSYATWSTSFTGGEGGEVVVEEETLAALVEHIIENLFVELGAEGYSSERLCLAACEYG